MTASPIPFTRSYERRTVGLWTAAAKAVPRRQPHVYVLHVGTRNVTLALPDDPLRLRSCRVAPPCRLKLTAIRRDGTEKTADTVGLPALLVPSRAVDAFSRTVCADRSWCSYSNPDWRKQRPLAGFRRRRHTGSPRRQSFRRSINKRAVRQTPAASRLRAADSVLDYADKAMEQENLEIRVGQTGASHGKRRSQTGEMTERRPYGKPCAANHLNRF
jgi:hypothetical protein